MALKPGATKGASPFPKPFERADHSAEQAAITLDVFHPGLDLEVEAFQDRPHLHGNVAPFLRSKLAACPVKQLKITLDAHIREK